MSHILKLFQSARGGQNGNATVETADEHVEIVSGIHETPVEQVHIGPDTRLVYHTDPGCPTADRFRFLRGRLSEIAKRAKLKTIMVTSPLPADGKSTVALNLATALAERGERSVLLIDGDMHHSPLLEKLGLNAWEGLAECLEGKVDPLAAVRRLSPLDWHLLPSGKKANHPTDLLQTPVLSTIAQSLAPHFDWIVIDAPPVIPITDAMCLLRVSDGVVMVVKAGQTPQEDVEESLNRLGREHVVGMILNGIEQADRPYSKYYKAYRG
jgi:succinoglycan biosynthesis transport protein ExoP